MKKLLAFTLAETLIVIGIIGVVSALTLPNLNSSTGEKEKVAKVKKIYQNLDDAIGRAVAVYGPVDEWFANDTTVAARVERFKNRVTEFMKVSKDCGGSTGCWSTNSLCDIRGDCYDDSYYHSLSEHGAVFVILADGTALAFGGYQEKDYKIRVDIDGPNKGKTTQGIDIFDFSYEENELFPSVNFMGNNYANGNGIIVSYETAWVINFDNMDYLKCESKLNWTNKTSCK